MATIFINNLAFKQKIFKKSGSNTSLGFYAFNNENVNYKKSVIDFNYFDLPMPSAITAGVSIFDNSSNLSIFDYYGRPQLSFSFSANHTSFSDSRYLKLIHDIYKIDYSDLLNYRSNPNSINWNIIKEKIENPYISYTAISSSVSLITSSGYTYVFSPEKYDKNLKNINEEIFSDKSMILFNTRHVFSGVANSYNNTIDLNEKDLVYNKEYEIFSKGNQNIIPVGNWAGLIAKGLYFCCFNTPSKPIIEDPSPESQSGVTFSPSFSFSNVEDGDSVTVEVTYDMSNSGFTNYSAITEYFFYKSDDNLEKNILNQKIRKVEVALLPDSIYWYRIGNVKTIYNIFENKQTIITYTDSYSATTVGTQIIGKESDSPYVKQKPTKSQFTNSSYNFNPDFENPER